MTQNADQICAQLVWLKFILPLAAALDTQPLQIQSTQISANDAVLIHIVGPSGQPFFLQFSTDNQQWADLTSERRHFSRWV